MARFKIYLEYEGTRYSGWQIQNNARTVQGDLVRVLKSVLQSDAFEFMGAGRTDAGVHALLQVAHLDAKTVLAPEIIRMKMNVALPADINILEIEKAPASFHARHDAEARSYLYQVSRRRTAFGKRYVWWVKDRLDADAMAKTLRLFAGIKDFRSFTDDSPEEKSTKVLIEKTELREEGDLILMRIVGSHFIWKMIRRIVGVTVHVGRGALDVEKVATFLHDYSNEPARLTAPPSGLFLEGVYYKGDSGPRPLTAMLKIGFR